MQGTSRRRRAARWAWRITLCLAVALGLVAGMGAVYIYSASRTVRTAVHVWHEGSWKPEVAFPKQDSLTLLIIGHDEDRDRYDRVINTNGRSDTLLLAKLDFTGKTANIVSIPRDTLVDIPGYSGQRKINAAYAYGGPELTMQTVEMFLGIYPEQFVSFSYDSFAKAIDELGGVEVTVDKQMDYDDNWGNLHIHLKPGTQALDGRGALGFVRFRKSKTGPSDSDQARIARQQQLLMAVQNKLLSPRAFLKIPQVIDTVRDGTKSSMTNEQMISVAAFIRSLPRESIRMATLPAEEGSSYSTVDGEKAQEMVDQMLR